jgi:hypothetical protein
MGKEGLCYYHNSFSDKIKERNYDVPIYRYVSLDFVLQMIITGELIIAQTKLWEDSYENFLTKMKFTWGNLPVSFRGFQSCFYGQCWTLTAETDALWRIYSPDKKSVRLKSKINKLLAACISEIDYKDFSTILRLVGPVSYLTSKQINDWVRKQNETLINASTLRESLFIKRREFNHENEVRVIIQKSNSQEEEFNGIQRSFIKTSIDPNQLIDEITFDPRLRNIECDTYTQVLRTIGYNNKINKSKLYDLPQQEF